MTVPVRLLASVLVSLLALLGCRAPLQNQVDVKALIADSKEPAFLSGRALGLGEPAVINNKDFVYAVAFDPEGRELAFVHHVTTNMELTVGTLEPFAARFTRPVNHHQFDVEDVALMGEADARFIATPSRQGIARRFSAQDGAPDAELIYGEPLLRIAHNPSQTLLAFGSSQGRVLLVDAKTFALRGEARLHEDEVQGLVFLDDRTLLSASFDGSMVKSRVQAGAPEALALAASALEGGAQTFLAHLDGKRGVAAVRDQRQPANVVTRAAVQRLGLPPVLERQLLVITPLGPELRPVVELGEVQLRAYTLGASFAAVCDGCVPEGAELVLGQPALRRALFGDDFSAKVVLVKPGLTTGLEAEEGEKPMAAAEGALVLVEEARLALPGSATDLVLDARRRLALVSYSHAKAERSPELYEAEKKGTYPPPSPTSGAVLVDLASFELGRRLVGHKGFTVTAALSPDGRTAVTGGWDKRLLVFDVESGKLVTERKLAWLARRARFSGDGRLLAVASWTPTNPIGEGKSDPSLLVYPVVFDQVEASPRASR
jgi:WD40 repeat protein